MISDIQMLIQIPHELAQNWGWFLALGIGLAILGLAAVVRSFAATVASMLFFGWLMVAASGIEIAQAVMVGHWAGFFQHLLAAILFGVVGLLTVVRPRQSAEVLTLVMAAFFLVGGLSQIVVAVSLALPGWGWQVADGAITLALGLLVMAEWPISGLWAIGLFLGIDLIFFGFAWTAIAFGLRSL
jgi:uncharacterized membrane protein HdeD (DUF308 family)